jgi:hypothetical protein
MITSSLSSVGYSVRLITVRPAVKDQRSASFIEFWQEKQGEKTASRHEYRHDVQRCRDTACSIENNPSASIANNAIGVITNLISEKPIVKDQQSDSFLDFW